MEVYLMLDADTQNLMSLPSGWREVQLQGGRKFYIGPSGPTWKPPTEDPVEPATKPKRCVPLASVTMCDYRPHTANKNETISFEARQTLSPEARHYSPSLRPHPRGAVTEDHRQSLYANDFQRPPPGAALNGGEHEPTSTYAALKVPLIDPYSSSYRAAFKRPAPQKTVACPPPAAELPALSTLGLGFRTTTQRTAFAQPSPSPSRSGRGRPNEPAGAPASEFWSSTMLRSTYQQGFTSGPTNTESLRRKGLPVPAPRSPSLSDSGFKRRGWSDVEAGWATGPYGGIRFGASTTYVSDFKPAAEHGFPMQATMTERTVDRSIHDRNHNHEEFADA